MLSLANSSVTCGTGSTLPTEATALCPPGLVDKPETCTNIERRGDLWVDPPSETRMTWAAPLPNLHLHACTSIFNDAAARLHFEARPLFFVYESRDYIIIADLRADAKPE